MNLYGFAGGDPVNFADPFGLEADCVRCAVWLLSRGLPALARLGAAATGLVATARAASISTRVAGEIERSGLTNAGDKVFEAGRRIGSMGLGQATATKAIEQSVTKLGLEQGPMVTIGGTNYVTAAQGGVAGINAIAVDKAGATSRALMRFGESGWEVVKNLGPIAAPQP